MVVLKAPGPDGFTMDFYQQYWSIVGLEICRMSLQFFNTTKMDANINVTHIPLIQKKKKRICLMSLISDHSVYVMCHTKLFPKVLANRLKKVLPQLISENQSAFIPGRLITDNILAAYEMLHSMHTRMWSKVGFMGIKLDMSKAYDRVE